MILKKKDKIMKHVKPAVPKMSKTMLKKCAKLMEEMEKLLNVWMQDQHQCQVLLSNADLRGENSL